MTPQQIQAVQTSFGKLEPVINQAAMLFYDRLFQLDPSLWDMFHSTRTEQARKLAHVLTVVVKSLNRPEQILGTVQELGRRHVGYGVRDEHYDNVGEALLWTLEVGLGEAFTPEVSDAWAAAYTMLATVMQEAAHAETVMA